jgi:adenylosuccinate synthase
LTPQSASRSVGTNHFSVPFTFVMPAGTCGLTTTVHGSGEYEFVETNHVRTPNGTRTIAISNVHAHGTALGDDGTRYDHVPYHQSVLHKVRPVYETLPGWECEIDDAERIEQLPDAARDYIQFVESLAGVPVSFVAVGPDRAQTVVLPNAA